MGSSIRRRSPGTRKPTGVSRGSTRRWEEFYKAAFRKKLYKTIEEIQADLDAFMEWYNSERTNHGRYCQGRTPMQTFLDGMELCQKHVYENPVEEKEVMM